ncbi:MAG TPA: hypothetical protein VHG51_05600, partial [Longimicrobiaceae bacterium]|nr:hypothetical protein [Longimicrobiaceae bacterium]
LGPVGPSGLRGPTGPTGPAGPSADPRRLVAELQSAVAQGPSGYAWDLVTTLSRFITGTGPVGPSGPTGPTGLGG